MYFLMILEMLCIFIMILETLCIFIMILPVSNVTKQINVNYRIYMQKYIKIM
jgi:hypothetical protein